MGSTSNAWSLLAKPTSCVLRFFTRSNVFAKSARSRCLSCLECWALPNGMKQTAWSERSPCKLTPPQPIPAFFRIKRAVDIVGSLALIILLSPIFLIAGLLVLVDVGPPVLFWQERLGWKGRSFLIYKFRTLRAPFDLPAVLRLSRREPSAIGRFLRATRIDELPQLLNVLLGDMSLVGPRPLASGGPAANTSLRLSVRPGNHGLGASKWRKACRERRKGKIGRVVYPQRVGRI